MNNDTLSASTKGFTSVFQTDLTYRTYNVLVAAVLILLAAPLLLVISTLLLVTQGSSIFYFGRRLGQNENPFDIIKFRTLDAAKARKLTKNKVLPVGSGIETPLGGLLRDTRLDELPQLFNILMGNMNLVGPRPVRPEIAAVERNRIQNYEARFRIKPGLVGPSQALLNHGVSKRIRARCNAMMLSGRRSVLKEVKLLALVGFCVLTRTVATLFAKLLRPKVKLARGYAAHRHLQVRLESSEGDVYAARPVDLQQIIIDRPVDETGEILCLALTLPDNRIRRAMVRIEGGGVATSTAGTEMTYRFLPVGDYAEHVITRYLHAAVVVPDRSVHIVPQLLHKARRRGKSRAIAT